ncbi:hypothetical protein AYL99_08293 [Fonsecaea erecta]|uniref:Uncharacterized protein n=1 Tax=Fonsecaea erecta TaxID=1367422 RepID=A0A178ZER9_9EURO|nr:hypothetical protein AYL99_08293 [Fonsecaea erecta]OAP57555.1 hypothetical protein AYL99_08293 [Fonsecaea erecta]
MASSTALQIEGVNTGDLGPSLTFSLPANIPYPEGRVPASKMNLSQDGDIKHGKDCEFLDHALHGPLYQVAYIEASTIEYPSNHLLGIPQEIRDTIVGLVFPPKRVVGSRPAVGCETFHFVCRQTYHESYRRFNTQPTVLVPSNKGPEFLKRTLNITTIKSNAYRSIKSLYLEIPQNSPSSFFLNGGEVLRYSAQLEELHLFGVGPDRYGSSTSSAAHPCGKHDMSIMSRAGKLPIDGQGYRRRLPLVNGIQWLEKLKVLALDNLNLPLTRAHVLMNKPRLESLHIAADPRSVLHGEVLAKSLFYAGHGTAPPVKELRVDANSILTASGVTARLAKTLESLDLVIPNMAYQVHAYDVNFLREASNLLNELHMVAGRLRELRICVHGAISEENHHYGNFMGALKHCVSRMKSLKVIELHVHCQSPWFAREFIEAVPPSVTRLYFSDLFVKRDVRELSSYISEKTKTPLLYAWEIEEAFAIGEDLQRKDYIQFSDNRLAFVGYEYDLFGQPSAANLQSNAMAKFLKLNGRMLDKERNRHLAHLKGRHIPLKEGSFGDHAEATRANSKSHGGLPACTQAKVEKYGKVLDMCGLGDNGYFGGEDKAEAVFEAEPAAQGGHFSYPAVSDVENGFTFSNHWLSK